MTSRRDFLAGVACAAAAGTAWARTPRNRLQLLGGAKLESLLPHAFGKWQYVPSDTIVTPQSKDSLASRLYSESVGRVYQSSDGRAVMMLIAYGDTQSDQLQLHRPEVCYPAFGFSVTRSAPAAIALGQGITLPGRSLTAESPIRTEQISYWTRIGEYLPQSGNEQRIAKLKCALDGIVPDGVLVRLSNIEPDPVAAFALNNEFAAAMLQGLAPKGRPALVGTDIARRLPA